MPTLAIIQILILPPMLSRKLSVRIFDEKKRHTLGTLILLSVTSRKITLRSEVISDARRHWATSLSNVQVELFMH